MRKIEKRALELIAENYGFEHQLEKLREELREADGAITSFPADNRYKLRSRERKSAL